MARRAGTAKSATPQLQNGSSTNEALRFIEDRSKHLATLTGNGMQVLGIPTFSSDWEEMIREEFPHHTRDVARINNGSFGCCPSSVLSSQASFQRQWLEQPDEFYFGPLEKGLRASRAAVARLVGCRKPEHVVLLDNATTATAMIAQQISWGFVERKHRPGNVILMLNCSYVALKNCFRAYAVRAGAKIVEVEISLPISSSEQIIDRFRAALEQQRQQRSTIILAVFDHITSMPSIVLPVNQLVKLCRAASVERVFVDGAHSAGNISFSVDEIGADFYCGTLHKWCFTPSSVGFLHVKPGVGEDLHHPIVSHNYCKGLWSECTWVGTRDYSAQLAVASAINFIEMRLGGVSALSDFNRAKAFEMATMLARAWGTRIGTAVEVSSAMVMVELPRELGVGVRSEKDALALQSRLRKDFGVEVIMMDAPGGIAYTRISHQIYNRREDYTRFRDAVLQLCHRALQDWI